LIDIGRWQPPHPETLFGTIANSPGSFDLSRLGQIIGLTSTPHGESSAIASAPASSGPNPKTELQSLVLSELMTTEPSQVTERPKVEDSRFRSRSSIVDSKEDMGVDIEDASPKSPSLVPKMEYLEPSFQHYNHQISSLYSDSLEATRNVEGSSVSKSDKTENEDSWSSVEELEPQRPLLDMKAREQTELTLETFWDVFNKHREELCRQRAAADRQAPSSATTSQPFAKQAANLSTAPSIPQLCGNSHSRADDDEDDSRYPKRSRTDLELPADRIESPRYSCPYRKHNRQRYNIHTRRTCALSWFSTIARLK
jgi:hypothetical protein